MIESCLEAKAFEDGLHLKQYFILRPAPVFVKTDADINIGQIRRERMAIQQESRWLKVASEPVHEGLIELFMKSLPFNILDLSMAFTELSIDNTLSY